MFTISVSIGENPSPEFGYCRDKKKRFGLYCESDFYNEPSKHLIRTICADQERGKGVRNPPENHKNRVS